MAILDTSYSWEQCWPDRRTRIVGRLTEKARDVGIGMYSTYRTGLTRSAKRRASSAVPRCGWVFLFFQMSSGAAWRGGGRITDCDCPSSPPGPGPTVLPSPSVNVRVCLAFDGKVSLGPMRGPWRIGGCGCRNPGGQRRAKAGIVAAGRASAAADGNRRRARRTVPRGASGLRGRISGRRPIAPDSCCGSQPRALAGPCLMFPGCGSPAVTLHSVLAPL